MSRPAIVVLVVGFLAALILWVIAGIVEAVDPSAAPIQSLARTTVRGMS